MDVVYVVGDAVLTLADGSVVPVRRGQHWPASDPVVQEKPDAFSADPVIGLAYSTPPRELRDTSVEAATANPGERRAARRG